MKNKSKTILIATFLSCIALLKTDDAKAATYVFDTGGPSVSGSMPVFRSGSNYQSIAATFTLLNDSYIGSLESMLSVANSGSLDFELTSGFGRSGSLIYSGSANLNSGTGYFGVHDLHLNLLSGSYTLTLLPGDGLNAYAFDNASYYPNGLSASWALFSDGNLSSLPSSVYRYSIRLEEGMPSPTPVPAPLPILGAVAALGWSRKLRRRIKNLKDKVIPNDGESEIK